MKWNIKTQIEATDPQERVNEIMAKLLVQRGLEDEQSIQDFLNPPDPYSITPKSVGIDAKQLKTAIKRIHRAIKDKQPIIVFGDYDADGITATAIMWEALHSLGANAHPFIPSREAHGYGLKVKAIEDALARLKPQTSNLKPIIITVDNGITAHEAAKYLVKEGIELIITDHHQPGKTLPEATAIVHTDQVAGSAVSWLVAKELSPQSARRSLDLVTIGTVADMLPLKGPNRTIVKAGIKTLPTSPRPGLQAIYQEAGIDPNSEFTTYHINFVIAPRLNAMGRLEHAIDSLRLLCTTSKSRAADLAAKLATVNSSRQDLTYEYLNKARIMVGTPEDNIIIIDHEDFHEGVIGLVAGKMTEEHYRPAIVISRGEEISKASSRSVSGVNIIEMIRQFEDQLESAGGHPMAAGFSIRTEHIAAFKNNMFSHANQHIQKDQLVPELDISAEITLEDIHDPLFFRLEELKPFGMANRQPVFAVQNVKVVEKRGVGKTNNHLKLTVEDEHGTRLGGIGFRLADHGPGKELLDTSTTHIDAAFTIDENIWNGRRNLQLKLKDIKLR